MKYTRVYTPEMTLKEVVIELAKILAETSPAYKEPIKELIEEMNKWETAISHQK